MDWHDFLTAIALCLVMEGILPFICPALTRRIMVIMSERKNITLRLFGAISMAVGVVLLYFAR